MSKRILTIVCIIVGLLTIGGTGWKFYDCKASKAEVAVVKDDFANFKLTDYRKELVVRIWQIEREFPNTYRNRMDWRQLTEELRLLDIKIEAYYKKGRG